MTNARTDRFQLTSKNNALWGPDGKRFCISGCSWFGCETPDQSLQGLWSVSMESILNFVQKNNFNFIRVPFSAQLVINGLDNSYPTNLNGSANPALAGKSAGAQLDRLFDLCAQRGIGIMLDLHRLINTQQSPLWYCDQYSEQQTISAWQTMAKRYKDKPSFLATDLMNEPQSAASWSDDPKTGWKGAAERIGKAIQGIAPHVLIGVQGIGGNNDSQGNAVFWGGDISGNTKNPINLPVKDKLFFLPHVYGPSVFMQAYFSDPNFPSNMPQIWDTQWQSVQGPAIAIGEWGGWGKDKDGIWQNAFVDYLVKNKRNDSFYWCICPTSGDTGGLLQDDWTTPVQWKLDLLARLCPNPGSIPKTSPQPSPQPSNPTPSPQPSNPTPSPQPSNPTPSPQVKPSSGVDLSVNLSSQYQAGSSTLYQYNITLTNNTGAALHNVYVSSSNTNINNFWNCNVSSDSGKIVIALPTWATQNSLASGATITYGVVVTGGQSNFKVLSQN